MVPATDQNLDVVITHLTIDHDTLHIIDFKNLGGLAISVVLNIHVDEVNCFSTDLFVLTTNNDLVILVGPFDIKQSIIAEGRCQQFTLLKSLQLILAGFARFFDGCR